MNIQEKFVSELKRKREKASLALKEVKKGQRDAEKRCRDLEEEREAIAEDYEGRLQQQVSRAISNHYTEIHKIALN